MLINMLMKSLQDWNKIKTRVKIISLNRFLNKGKLNEGNEIITCKQREGLFNVKFKFLSIIMLNSSPIQQLTWTIF